MQTNGHLTVVLASHRPGVLALHAHRVAALLGEAGVVDYPRLQFGQLRLAFERKTLPHRLVRPTADRYALLQALSHPLDRRLFIDEPPRHRRDALAVAIEQQAREVVLHRLSALGPAHPYRHRFEVGRQLPVESFQLSGVHIDGRSHPRIAVNLKVSK
jgi:hypothetical protein